MHKLAPKIATGISLALMTAGFASTQTAAMPTLFGDRDTVKWERVEAPTETYITGGPWTLEQSGAAVGLKSAGYCDATGHQIGNPGSERMQPYYFPFNTGQGDLVAPGAAEQHLGPPQPGPNRRS